MQLIQYQEDAIKHKMVAKDLEKQLEARETELKAKLEENKKQNQAQMKKLADEYETQIQKLKNSVTSLQNELNIECNQMSAQEEMMHGLLHSICSEFSSFVDLQKETTKSSRYQRKQETASGSYLDEKAKTAYEN